MTPIGDARRVGHVCRAPGTAWGKVVFAAARHKDKVMDESAAHICKVGMGRLWRAAVGTSRERG